jgi:outer membrane lipoprotein-sorting protein
MRICFKLSFVLLFSCACLCGAQDLSDKQVMDLIKKVDAKSNPRQYESYMSMANYEPGNRITENRLHFYRKDDKMLAVTISPAIQRGQALIRNGDDMWMFMPKSKKVMRIGAKEKSLGGEAANTDLLRVDLAADYQGTYLEQETVEGVLCNKLELKAKDRKVAYDKVIYWVSVQKDLPVKREFYTLSGMLLKTMYFRQVKSFGNLEIPSVIIIENARNNEYRTEMEIEELNTNVDIKDHLFTPSYIKRGTTF